VESESFLKLVSRMTIANCIYCARERLIREFWNKLDKKTKILLKQHKKDTTIIYISTTIRYYRFISSKQVVVTIGLHSNIVAELNHIGDHKTCQFNNPIINITNWRFEVEIINSFEELSQWTKNNVHKCQIKCF